MDNLNLLPTCFGCNATSVYGEYSVNREVLVHIRPHMGCPLFLATYIGTEMDRPNSDFGLEARIARNNSSLSLYLPMLLMPSTSLLMPVAPGCLDRLPVWLCCTIYSTVLSHSDSPTVAYPMTMIPHIMSHAHRSWLAYRVSLVVGFCSSNPC